MKTANWLWLFSLTLMFCFFYESNSLRNFKVEMAKLKYSCEKLERK